MLPSRLKCDSCTCPTKHTHKDAALLQFISVCLPPAPLLCLWVWTVQPLCSVKPRGPGDRANEREDGWKEEKQKDNLRAKERGGESVREEQQHHLLSLCFFFPQSRIAAARGKEGRERGQSLLHLLYSCCWLTCDISVWPLDHGRLQCLGKGQAALRSPPNQPPPLNSAPTIICVSFLCILMFSDLHS